MPAYRPSCALRLQARIDEGRGSTALAKRLEPHDAAHAAAVRAAVPEGGLEVTAEHLGTLRKLDALTGGADPALKRALEQALAARPPLGHGTGAPPVAIGAPAEDGLSITIGSLPVLSCEIERSSFRTGDKARFTLSYWDCPFDPRLMRAAAIEIVIGVASPLEHDAGMHGLTRPDGSRYSVVEDAPGITEHTRFIGFVSKWEIEFGEDGATVRGEAEDLMGLVRDTPMPPNLEIDHDLPIEQGVGALLDSFPALRGIHVQYEDDTAAGPRPGTAAARRRKLVKKGKKRIRRNAENSTVWDHITDVCIGTNLIPVLDGLTLRLSHARTLYGKTPDVPRMVWGRNLQSLSFARTMSGFKNATVEVRSYNPDKRREYAARYPDPKNFGLAILGERDFPRTAQRSGRMVPSGQKADEPVRVMIVHDVAPSLLPEIARGVYEETARQEIEGTFSTRDCASFGADLARAGLLKLKAGDSIALEIDARGQGEVADRVTRMHGMAFAERVAHLEQAGFRRAVAMAYAALLDRSNLQTVYRVASARLSFDHEEGLTVDCDFQNYITLREDRLAAEAEAPTRRRRAAVKTDRKAARRAVEGVGGHAPPAGAEAPYSTDPGAYEGGYSEDLMSYEEP